MTLTKRQHEVLVFIRDSIAANGYAPSLEEIGAALGLRSMATVHKHVSNLEGKGYIRRKWNHSRSIEVVPMVAASPVAVPGFVSVPVRAWTDGDPRGWGAMEDRMLREMGCDPADEIDAYLLIPEAHA